MVGHTHVDLGYGGAHTCGSRVWWGIHMWIYGMVGHTHVNLGYGGAYTCGSRVWWGIHM